jgi:hypothetical protein
MEDALDHPSETLGKDTKGRLEEQVEMVRDRKSERRRKSQESGPKWLFFWKPPLPW